MNNPNIPRIVTLRHFAWSAITLCIGCCAAVPVLVLFGVASAASLAIYFEFAAAGLFIASLLMFGYLMLKNKKPSCKTNCSGEDRGT